MSQAFINEDDAHDAGDLLDRPQSAEPNYVTAKGLAQLRQKADELAARRASLAGKRNDPLGSRQFQQAERDLLYFQSRLESAILVDPATQPADAVHFGASVEARDGEGALLAFSIVGLDEADAAEGKVGWTSPIASALMGARAGDKVVWKREAGDAVLEILSIRYPRD
ncbi:MAG: hypothetical protein A3G41_07470 [Elusimicrobia bacterium RIFCSPLOWO2_12_FULL_59_9]|nr:MAG: hypothetical protein A3G41_07470 [Elusimicrobia bacterium RIFCSPLOWO2_12_FULL_59_9]